MTLDTAVTDKIYGALEDLLRTAVFIEESVVQL
jgi:hypothetical protein